jgi:hypothetical protein
MPHLDVLEFRMKLIVALVAGCLTSGVCIAGEAVEAEPLDSLEQTILRLDAAVFDAFNRCSDPTQLQKHAGYFSENVEFYHDTGGVTWNRADMIANTQKYACGRFTRELIPASVSVYPIKGFGAIEHGAHRFCQDRGTCEGIADFMMVWRQTPTGWEITRVLSYGHRAVEDGG